MRIGTGLLILAMAACGPGMDNGVGGGGGTAGGTGGSGGSGGGGGGTSSSAATCTQATDCAAFSCSCPDGKFWNSARYCLNRVCQGQASTCADACKDHQGAGGGGGSGSGGGGGSSTASVYGCALSKFSNDFSVSVEMYGSHSARGTALAEAQQQCTRAKWTSTFCSAAFESCVLEPATTYSCTYEKYSSSAGSTIRFYGSGTGKTAAKAAAVDACIASGKWQGWFCSSGILICSPG